VNRQEAEHLGSERLVKLRAAEMSADVSPVSLEEIGMRDGLFRRNGPAEERIEIRERHARLQRSGR
jgi:hypothetical protein